MREEKEEEELLTKMKSLCVDRIQKAWNRQIEDILESNHRLTENLGRDTLRVLATLAEQEPLSRVKPILVSCIHERARKEPTTVRAEQKDLPGWTCSRRKRSLNSRTGCQRRTRPYGRRERGPIHESISRRQTPLPLNMHDLDVSPSKFQLKHRKA